MGIDEVVAKFRTCDDTFEKHGLQESERDYAGFTSAARTALDFMLAAMFPRFFADGASPEYLLANARENLIKSLRYVLGLEGMEAEIDGKMVHIGPQSCADRLVEKLPELMRVLHTDLVAAYQGDPAAKTVDEVILSYPAFKAISSYRIAHELYLMKVPILPRFLTEYAHQLTGIDIHPGATIGNYFFIDHGTGVVIGETTTIGEHVKLYQHVTLGAKSFEVGEDGALVKGIKRHPDIGNNVVIYAGATILGGGTRIGDGAVIGGNVWLTHSVDAGEVITIRE